MDIASRLSVSYYKDIATISEDHKVYIVQHIQTGKIFIKKILDVYNKSIYDYLLSNPILHTPRIHALYENANSLEIIEDYISGDTLEDLLSHGTHFNEIQIKNIISQLCLIIKDLHSCKPEIIHRDIKPSNIILSPSGEVYLLDFNAAKYYSNQKDEDTSLLGTKGYAAPEQYGFGISTPQTDIYAIGMLLKELTSHMIPQGKSYDSEFESIISKCTKLDAKERYKDIDSILRVLNKSKLPNNNRSNKPEWTKFLPPGFRSLSPLSMILSGIGYASLFWICLSMSSTTDSGVVLMIERIGILLFFLSIIFVSSNYLNIQMSFPPCRTQNVLLRIIAVLFLDILIFLAFAMILYFLVAIAS